MEEGSRGAGKPWKMIWEWESGSWRLDPAPGGWIPPSSKLGEANSGMSMAGLVCCYPRITHGSGIGHGVMECQDEGAPGGITRTLPILWSPLDATQIFPSVLKTGREEPSQILQEPPQGSKGWSCPSRGWRIHLVGWEGWAKFKPSRNSSGNPNTKPLEK